MSYLRELEKELRFGIDHILTHPFLKRINSAQLTKGQLSYFAEQYAVYCRYFPRFLSATAANIPDDSTRLPIIENLWEEHGEGKLSKSHRILYDRFAFATGMSDEALRNPTPLSTTEIAVEHLLDTCMGDDFLVGLGALGPGTEFFTNEEYMLIEKGLKKYPFLTDDDIYFWTAHIALDEAHYSDIVAAILPWTNTVSNRHQIKQGAKKAIDLEILFWDGLEDNLPNI